MYYKVAQNCILNPTKYLRVFKMESFAKNKYFFKTFHLRCLNTTMWHEKNEKIFSVSFGPGTNGLKVDIY